MIMEMFLGCIQTLRSLSPLKAVQIARSVLHAFYSDIALFICIMEAFHDYTTLNVCFV